MNRPFHPSELYDQSPWAPPWRAPEARAGFSAGEVWAGSPWRAAPPEPAMARPFAAAELRALSPWLAQHTRRRCRRRRIVDQAAGVVGPGPDRLVDGLRGGVGG